MNTPALTSSQEANAPWNKDKIKMKFIVTVSQTLSKEATIETNKWYEDEEGDVQLDVDNVCLEDEYCGEQLTPEELIDFLRDLLENMKASGTASYKSDYDKIIENCKRWFEDDFIVEY